MHIVLDGRQLIHLPCFANRKASIRVLSPFVDTDQLGFVYRNNNDPLLLILRIGIGRCRRLWVLSVFLDANVCDVGFKYWNRVSSCAT